MTDEDDFSYVDTAPFRNFPAGMNETDCIPRVVNRSDWLIVRALREMVRLNCTPSDIIFIGSAKSGHSCTWEEFKKLADGVSYIPEDLKIVFKDGSQLIKFPDSEYPYEAWIGVKSFSMPVELKPIKNIEAATNPYSNLEDLQPI